MREIVCPQGLYIFSLYSSKWYYPFTALLRYSSSLIMTAYNPEFAYIRDPKGVKRQPVWTTTREQKFFPRWTKYCLKPKYKPIFKGKCLEE